MEATTKKNKKVKAIVFEEQVLTCACSNPNHNIQIKYNEKLNSAYCEIHINKLSFWKRLKNAIMYLFNRDSKFGEYDEFIFDERHADILINLGKALKK